MTKPLSPTAQAVLDAVQQDCHETDAEFAAAAIRALVEAKLPEEPLYTTGRPRDEALRDERQRVRRESLAVADELEGEVKTLSDKPMTCDPDFRALCAELFQALEHLDIEYDAPIPPLLLESARAALSTPPFLGQGAPP